jgi:lysophospholipase L1-like esterase
VRAVLRYVALGDSYTIGTSVTEPERWPNQIVARLGAGGGMGSPGAPAALRLVANLGVNGYTSGDVLRAELPRLDDLRPEFASLLVGVNDVVQRVPDATYRANVKRILDALLARLPAARIVTVGTPDYTVTPAGADYGDPATQRAGIERVNAILAELTAKRGIRFVDIWAISQAAAIDRTLVARDGLHPSGAQYASWVERIAPAVIELLAVG